MANNKESTTFVSTLTNTKDVYLDGEKATLRESVVTREKLDDDKPKINTKRDGMKAIYRGTSGFSVSGLFMVFLLLFIASVADFIIINDIKFIHILNTGRVVLQPVKGEEIITVGNMFISYFTTTLDVVTGIGGFFADVVRVLYDVGKSAVLVVGAVFSFLDDVFSGGCAYAFKQIACS